VAEDNPALPIGLASSWEKPRGDEADVSRACSPAYRSSPIDDLPLHLLQTLQQAAPWTDNPQGGAAARQGFQHATSSLQFLPQQMGIQLVEGPNCL